MRNAVGFYWTLPVPWAGFATLPEEIDAASKVSRTIRYQREVIRRHAKENNYLLVTEKVFLEIAPDRGSRSVLDALRPVEAVCRSQKAVLLLVDFSEVQGWRSHGPLSDLERRTCIGVETVYPGEILIDGRMFDPHEHFSEWRGRQQDWIDGKADRLSRAREAARHLRSEGKTYNSIAEVLNAEGIRSATGKPWAADNVRRLLGS